MSMPFIWHLDQILALRDPGEAHQAYSSMGRLAEPVSRPSKEED